MQCSELTHHVSSNISVIFRWICFGGALRISNRVDLKSVLLTLPSVLQRYIFNFTLPIDLSVAYPERYLDSFNLK